MQTQRFKIFADYFQFYLWDETTAPEPPEVWSDEDCRRRIKVAPHVVVICPVRNMTVPVEIRIHEKEPSCDAEQWDHIAECSLNLPGGKLEIHECTGGSAGRFEVAPGCYRLRAQYGALDTLRDNHLDGDDHYLIDLWPGSGIDLKIVKNYDGPA